MMHRVLSNWCSTTTAALLLAVVVATFTNAAAFSFSRGVHDVHQNVVEDVKIYPKKVHFDTADMGKSASSQKGMIENYVLMRNSPSGDLNVTLGQRVELTCQVDGSPPPQIHWIVSDKPTREVERFKYESLAEINYKTIGRESSKLVIDCVTPLDDGYIYCVGVAGGKTTISKPTILKVVKPTDDKNMNIDDCSNVAPVITRNRPLVLSEMGSTVVLPCQAYGNPEPSVMWLDSKNNDLTNNSRFSVQPDGTLVISDLIWDDMGGYKCVASSKLGATEASTFLYPAAKSTSGKKIANAL